MVGGHTWKRRNTRNTYCSASPPWPGWWAAFELGRNLGGLEGWRWAIGAGVRW
ncbi:peptidoglycan-binding domain-containing protein [Meiothermus phage MMP7]|nr:peptidoglycan-binding domain-containing protein [Meiothermus phage MMP7]